MEKEVKKKKTTESSNSVKNKKTNSSKKNTTAKKEVITKNVGSENNITSKKDSKKFDSTKLLIIVFALLIVLVVVLGILVVQKDKETKKEVKANIVIPVLDKASQFDFSINAEALAKSDGYVFKITNFKGDKINKKEIDYTITIENGTDSTIEITKDGENTDLMEEQISTKLENNRLLKDKKDSSYYVVKMISSGKIGKDEMINVKVTS